MTAMTALNADCFFGIVLSHQKQVNFADVVKLRNDIQKTYPEIVVNLSGYAVREATILYSSFFQLNDDNILKIAPSARPIDLDFVKQEFSEEIPIEIIDRVDNYVRQNI